MRSKRKGSGERRGGVWQGGAFTFRFKANGPPLSPPTLAGPEVSICCIVLRTSVTRPVQNRSGSQKKT